LGQIFSDSAAHRVVVFPTNQQPLASPGSGYPGAGNEANPLAGQDVSLTNIIAVALGRAPPMSALRRGTRELGEGRQPVGSDPPFTGAEIDSDPRLERVRLSA